MYKKIFSAILFGVLTIASTSTFVSCKDYDDDINNLQDQIKVNDADNAALHTALTTLDTKVADLKTQLEAADARLAALIQDLQTATEENKAAITAERNRALEAESALEARIATAESAIEDLKALLDKKVDKTVFDEKVQEIYAKIEAVETGLGKALTEIESLKDGLKNEEAARKAAVEDLQQQINALKAYEARIAAIEGMVPANLETTITSLTSTVTTLQTATADIETLKDTMQKLADKVAALEAGGSTNVINVLCNCNLKALVFIPDTYYYGIEATTIKALQPKWYTNMIALTTYIDKADNAYYSTTNPNTSVMPDVDKVYKHTENNRVEDIGIKGKPVATNEDRINDYTAAGALTDHERYTLSTGTISVILSAEANYHLNPSNAKLDEETATVSVIDDEKSYVGTRASSARISVATANDGSKLWNTKNGILSVPLYVQNPNLIKEVHYTVSGTEATPSNNSAVTIFATQVEFEGGEAEDTVITSDYAALIVEEAKDLRLSHVKHNPTGTNNLDFIQTGMFNLHCGDCSLPVHTVNGVRIPAYNNKGLHLFGSIEEARYYVRTTPHIEATAPYSTYDYGEGQDLVLYTEDIDLTALIETHYTNENGQHAVFNAEDFDRNFEYRFELTSFKFSTENTDESAHAALYKNNENGHWYLHPQDPVAGGLYGRPYTTDVATPVVVNRVPLVRVSLVYTKEDKVVDYGYLPIRIIQKPIVVEEQPAIAFDRYKDETEWKLTKWNNCYLPNDKGFTLTTNWRQTEEDLMSHDSLKHVLDRVTFEQVYSFEGTNWQDLPQYTFTKTANGTLNGKQQYKYVFTACPTPGTIRTKTIGNIAYDEGISLSGTVTSVLKWTVNASEIQQLAAGGINKVERAIKLVSSDKYNYPDLYVIFETGTISVENKTVSGDAEITKHIIKQYWYTDASNDALANADDADEIHANTITPEENTAAKGAPYTAWKPTVLDDRFADVFYNNFNGTNAPIDWIKLNPSTPFNKTNLVVDFLFDTSNDGRTFYGFIDNAKNDYQFTIKTRYSGALDKDLNGNSVAGWSETARGNLGTGKYLYAQSKLTNKVQIIATIDKWDADDDNAWTIAELQQMKISLNRNSNYARALLNYVSPKEMWSLKKGTLTTLPKNPSIDNILNATVALNVVSFKHVASGQTYECPMTLTNNLFDVRFLRPISIKEGDGPTIQDAAGNSTTGTNPTVDYGQKVELDKLVTGYEDWRSLWKTNPSYEEYYAPEGSNQITVTVDALNPGDNLATNPNVYTDINGTRQRLNAVHGDIEFTIDSGDPNILWYRNNSSTVNDFHVWIPVMVEYYWGEIYTEIQVTVQKTKEVKRQ